MHAQAKAEIKDKGFLVSSVLGSQNLLIETDTFTGIILLEQENASEGSTVYLPSVKEVLLAEEILLSCFEKDTVDFSHDSMFISKRRIYPLSRYKRQYTGSYDKNGDKMIRVSFSLGRKNEPWQHDSWLRRQQIVRDGGNSYWSISINLKTKRCGYFMVNGLALDKPALPFFALNI
ncbi:hypothetical protein [Nibribacter koreensis]|uniref:Uncharacterized protein n=1 Tax=Nibribacter koreensis TaxID=1084519 RepID=A0ABP8FRC7_9BACT